MQRLNNAFRFIGLNFRLALKHEAIQKPWMFLSLGGILLTLFWWIPLGVLIMGLGPWPFAWVLVGLILFLYLMSLQIWGEITALQTAQIFANLVHEDADYRAAHPVKGIFQSPWPAVLAYVLSVPGLTLRMAFREILSGSSPTDQAWMKVHPLIPPILALEGSGLQAALKRVKQIVQDNLLRFQPGYLPVGWVARGIAWISTLVGAVAGVLIAGWLADPILSSSWRAFLAVSVGMSVLGIFSMVGIAFSTYFRTCYHTALYAWVLAVEGAQRVSREGLASPPEILSRAMTKKPKQRKEGSDATKT